MMAYEGSKNTRDNFSKFIHQYQPEIKTPIRKLERILIKLYRQVKLATLVEGDQNASFSKATTPRYRGGRYTFP